MSDTNPNYVPVDWGSRHATQDRINDALSRPVLGDTTVGDVLKEMRDTEAQLNATEGACPATCPYVEPHHHVHDEVVFTTPVTAETLNRLKAELTDPARETSTLNSAGDPIKVGDRVHHLADAGQDERDTGVVTGIGPVMIHGTLVENGAAVRWHDDEKPSYHHVDLLTVLL